MGPRRSEGATDPPALAFGGGITLLGVIRLLGRAGIPVRVVSRDQRIVPYSRWFVRAPEPLPRNDVDEVSGYLRALPLKRAVLIPSSDAWARTLASLDPSLRDRFPASLPSPEVQDQLVDKGEFARLLQRTGTPHPHTLVVDGPDDLVDLDRLPMEQMFVKPRDSQKFFWKMGVKALRASGPDEVRRLVPQLAEEGLRVVIQEYVPGPASHHYFVDGFMDASGGVRGRLVRQRLRMYPTDFGNSSYMKTIPAADAAPAVDAVESLLGSISFRGVYSAELKLDPRDGVFRLLEVNARPWWYVEFAARCGVDVVHMAYQDALGRDVAPALEYAVGRRLAYPRYDLYALMDAMRAGRAGPLELLRSWTGSHRPIFSWDDPMPALREGAHNVRASLVRRLPGRRPAN